MRPATRQTDALFISFNDQTRREPRDIDPVSSTFKDNLPLARAKCVAFARRVWFTQGQLKEIQAGETDVATWTFGGEFPRLIHDALIKACTFRLKQGPDGTFSNEQLTDILKTQ